MITMIQILPLDLLAVSLSDAEALSPGLIDPAHYFQPFLMDHRLLASVEIRNKMHQVPTSSN